MSAIRRRRSALRWLFEDRRTGEIVVGQTPNLLLWMVVASAALRALPMRPAMSRSARRVNLASLGLFGLDELTRGVNPFLRLGGTLVLLFVGRLVLICATGRSGGVPPPARTRRARSSRSDHGLSDKLRI